MSPDRPAPTGSPGGRRPDEAQDALARREANLQAQETAASKRQQMQDERTRKADEREAAADQREREADSRETLADQREQAADEREAAADHRDQAAGQRENVLGRGAELLERAQDKLARSRAAIDRSDARIAQVTAALLRASDRDEREQAEIDREIDWTRRDTLLRAMSAAKADGTDATLDPEDFTGKGSDPIARARELVDISKRLLKDAEGWRMPSSGRQLKSLLAREPGHQRSGGMR
jgi:hypothetical protein